MTQERRRRAASLLMVGFRGTEAPGWLVDQLAGGLRGVVLFRRNVESAEQVTALNRVLCEAGAELVAVDEEGGRVRRLRGITLDLPPMRELGGRGDPTLTRELGAALGRQLRALGFHANFAPVLDVDTNPENPVIGDRAFGRTPEAVVATALPFALGLQASGVAACGKHFPGHGDTAVDSHLGLPRIEHDEERLRAVELAPFRAAAEAGIASLMTAHVAVDAWRPGVPSTLDRHALTLLREEIGYRGVVISDDLEMKAVRETYGIGEAVSMGLEAGIDLFLVCEHRDAVEEAIATLERASEDPGLRDRIDEAAARVDDMAVRYGRRSPPPWEDARVALARERLPAGLALASADGADPTERV